MYRVYDYTRTKVYSNTFNNKKYGDNRFVLDFNCKLVSGDYILEVENEKGEIFKLRFKYVGTPPGPMCMYMIIESIRKTI